MNQNETINYLELPAKNLAQTKTFFKQVFNWTFEDYGSKYSAFSEKNFNGGFYQADLTSKSENGAALIIFYSNNLDSTIKKIEQAKGKIIKPTFSFPGGRRFHFTEPSGNEFAVWSDK